MDVYFKYLYPLFGSTSPFQTSITRGADSEKTVHRGYCNFLFPMKPSRLHASFQKPLVIQSFGKVDGIEREVGLCVIDLIQILPKSGGNLGCFDEWVSVLNEGGCQGEVFDLN
eukprot:UN04787